MSARTLTDYEATRLILAAKRAGYLLSSQPIVRNGEGQALAIRLRYKPGRGSVAWMPHLNDEQAFRLLADARVRNLETIDFSTHEGVRQGIISLAALQARKEDEA